MEGRRVGSQQALIEDIMDLPGTSEFEAVSGRAHFFSDGERSSSFVVEFFVGLVHFQVPNVQPY